MRGYTIALPSNRNDLYMIYEDVKFYSIISLIYKLEEILEIRMSYSQRSNLRTYIKNKSPAYEIEENIDNVNDAKLVDIKHEIDNSEHIETIFEGILSILKYIDRYENTSKEFSHDTSEETSLSNKFEKEYATIFPLLREIVSDNRIPWIQFITKIASLILPH